MIETDHKRRLPTERQGVTHRFTIFAKGGNEELQKEMEDIVTRLAAIDPGTVCQFCRSANHLESCLWRRAKTVQDHNGVHEVKGYVSTGVYPDGKLAEAFIKVGKSGAESAWCDEWAKAASIALQYGAPVDNFFSKFVGTNFGTAGLTKSKEFPTCSSILDYVSKWTLARYGGAR